MGRHNVPWRDPPASGDADPIVDNHAPAIVCDPDWSFRAHGYQTGYIQGLLRAITDLTS